MARFKAAVATAELPKQSLSPSASQTAQLASIDDDLASGATTSISSCGNSSRRASLPSSRGGSAISALSSSLDSSCRSSAQQEAQQGNAAAATLASRPPTAQQRIAQGRQLRVRASAGQLQARLLAERRQEEERRRQEEGKAARQAVVVAAQMDRHGRWAVKQAAAGTLVRPTVAEADFLERMLRGRGTRV